VHDTDFPKVMEWGALKSCVKMAVSGFDQIPCNAVRIWSFAWRHWTV